MCTGHNVCSGAPDYGQVGPCRRRIGGRQVDTIHTSIIELHRGGGRIVRENQKTHVVPVAHIACGVWNLGAQERIHFDALLNTEGSGWEGCIHNDI